MIYRSNLTAPDLTPYFRHLHSRPMPHSFGHDVPSDWADKADDDPVFGIYKRCGLWTHDEAAILFNVALRRKGPWIDIGAHTGWTTMHASVGAFFGAYPIDPLHAVMEARERFCENFQITSQIWCGADIPSSAYFRQKRNAGAFANGFVIDGDHEPGEPLKDAQGAARHLADTGVIIFHDGLGRPVREAVEWLMTQGFHVRPYYTPHLLFCCWRGDFRPPDHVPDPNLPDLRARCPEFPWEKTE